MVSDYALSFYKRVRKFPLRKQIQNSSKVGSFAFARVSQDLKGAYPQSHTYTKVVKPKAVLFGEGACVVSNRQGTKQFVGDAKASQDESCHLSLATCHFEDCNAKAELNHRSQACEVLTGTGVRVAKIGLPSRSLGEGRSSIRVARPVFRFGLPSVALSPNKTSPPSHKAMEGILRSDSTKVGS